MRKLNKFVHMPLDKNKHIKKLPNYFFFLIFTGWKLILFKNPHFKNPHDF
jgi:hypothetical protein